MAVLCEDARLATKHGHLALADFKPKISAQLMQHRERLLERIASGGANAPARMNLIEELGISDKDMQVLVKLLVEDGSIIVLEGNLMLRSMYDDCRAKLLELFAQQKIVEVAQFRDAVGTNRKMAVAMLDSFDAERLTRRIADGRVLAQMAAPATHAAEGRS
jgi:selenocysteine-specific elongation factor